MRFTNSSKQTIAKAVVGGLVTLVGAGGLGLSKQSIGQINIQPGEVKYSNGESLKSDGYATCSALILDYGNSAVMVHAIGANDDQNLVDIGKVVQMATEKLEDEGINPKESEALVNAGSKSSYDKILDDLKREGIKVRSASYVPDNDPHVRDILYNPVTNELIIRSSRPIK